MSSSVQTQVRIDANIKKQVVELFDVLGLDMSTAINMFLHKCLLTGGIPFEVTVPSYKKEVIEAMKEAKKISKDPNVKSYNSFDELVESLNDDEKE